MKRVICIFALVLCAGCATSGKFELGQADLDLRSDKRIAIEEAKPVAVGEPRLAAVPIIGPILDLLSGKPGRLQICLFRYHWGLCPSCGEEVAADE